MTLVTLVVVGHLLLVMPPSDQQSRVYDFLYSFHIAAFIVVTGYLSRTFRYSRRHLFSVLTTLVVPYFVFSWLLVWFRHLVGHEELLDPIWSDPRWPMWYLVVTALWRLATPVLRLHWLMIPASIGVSLLAGVTDEDLLDLTRFLSFLPFFVIGLHLRREHLDLLRTRVARLAAVPAVLLAWWVSGHTDDWWSTESLLYRTSYGELGMSLGEGAWMRIRLIALALLMTAAVLALVPRGRTLLTDRGAHTLVVYLCHAFVVLGLEYWGWTELLPAGHPWACIAVNTALAVAVALALASRPATGVLRWVVDPVNTALQHRRSR